MAYLSRIGALSLLLSGGTALAQAAPPAAPAAPSPITVTGTKEDVKDPDQVVCRRETDTGSRIKSTKVCMSRRQWAEQGRTAQKAIADFASNMEDPVR